MRFEFVILLSKHNTRKERGGMACQFNSMSTADSISLVCTCKSRIQDEVEKNKNV